MMTGTAGGLLRDVLSAQVPFILRKGELYAAASIPGAVLFVVLRNIGAGSPLRRGQLSSDGVGATTCRLALAIDASECGRGHGKRGFSLRITSGLEFVL